MIRCLILEDEKSAVEILQNYIDKTPNIDCLGVYESGLDIPLEKLQQTDLLFLDIQLPEINGLAFIKTLHYCPKIIITSAYANYAIEAFDQAVDDYLVKPYSYERFYKAFTRVRVSLNKKDQKKQLLLYADKTFYKTNIEDIIFLKAEVDYVKVVTVDNEILILDSLQHWEIKLSNWDFIRTHRSYIVNIDRIEKVSGNQIFMNDEVIPIGRTYKDGFLKTLKSITNFS